MRHELLRYFSTLTFGLGLSACALASVTYVVKTGDTLSKIAGRIVSGPVWGEKGSLKSVLALNPHIKNPDLIYPGQRLTLPSSGLAQALSSPHEPFAAGPAPLEILAHNRQPATETRDGGSLEGSRSEGEPGAVQSEHVTRLEIAPYYALSDLSATDSATGSSAKLASSLNAGVDLRYFQHLSERFQSFVHLRLGSLSFEQPTASSGALENGSHFMSGIGVGGELSLSHTLSFRLSADYQKEVFASAISSTTVAIDPVSVPELSGALSWDFLQSHSWSLGVTGEVSELFPVSTGNYTVLSGQLYGGALDFRQGSQGFRESSFQTELGFYERNQNTSLTNQSEKDFVLQVRFSLPCGGRSGP